MKTPTDNTSAPLPLQILAASIPYAAVLIGLYAFSSAWLAIAIYYTTVITYLTATRQTAPLKSLTRGFSIKPILVAAPIFALTGPAIYLLLPLSVRPDLPLANFLGSVGLSQWRYPLFALVFCAVNPALEEAFWRGAFRASPRRLSWTDFAFAAYHIPVVIMAVNIPLTALSFLILIFTAWSFRILKHKTNGLATPYLVHLIADISILTAVWYLTNP